MDYQFISAFPKLIAAVPVKYGEAQILRVTVSFNYDRYIVDPVTTIDYRTPTAVAQTVVDPTLGANDLSTNITSTFPIA